MPTTIKKAPVKKTSAVKKNTSAKSLSAAKSSNCRAPVYNLQAEKVADINLNENIFGVKINDKLIAQSIRVYLANQRRSHAKVKDRGEVAGTTKKMYAQKGTGRARHSTAKVGLFVGGGSVHGPQGNQNFKLTLNQKTRRVALKSILSLFAKESKIICIEDLNSIEPKTKTAWNLIDKIENQNKTVSDSEKIAIIYGKESQMLRRAFRNIPGFTLISTETLNTYQLANQNLLIFDKKSLEALK